MPNLFRSPERLEKLERVRQRATGCEICNKYERKRLFRRLLGARLNVCEHCLGVYCRRHWKSPDYARYNPKYDTLTLCCPICGEFILRI